MKENNRKETRTQKKEAEIIRKTVTEEEKPHADGAREGKKE